MRWSIPRAGGGNPGGTDRARTVAHNCVDEHTREHFGSLSIHVIDIGEQFAMRKEVRMICGYHID
jgi:hypothetical protein